MAYIGNTPAEAFSSFQKQDFSTSATTSYTLDHPVSNQNEIALFINFVRQEPTAAYTASGTTLTLTSATSSSDDMYCVYLGKAVQTVNPASGSVGSSQVASTIITGQTAETSIATDDTILIHDTSASALRKMTRANFVSGVGGANTPNFSAFMTGDQSISAQSWTKVQMNTEHFDSAGAFDHSSNYRFTVPSGQAGKYFFSAGIGTRSTSNDVYVSIIGLYKNGSIVHSSRMNSNSTSNASFRGFGNTLATSLDLSAGDYVEIYGIIYGTSPIIETGSDRESYFQGFKIIE
jgi:hypothetical protein